MRYFANPSTPRVRDAMTAGHIDMIATPKQGQAVPPGAAWCADNGCFGKGYPGDDAWLAWLDTYTPDERARCLFATAPDVVAHAPATLVRSAPYLAQIRGMGYPAALVAQDGLQSDAQHLWAWARGRHPGRLQIPWDEFDVLFVGGSTAWKLGPDARRLAAQAKAHGKWVHVGRVNSEQRLRYSSAPYPYGLGADSADGTYIAFGPDRNLPNVLAWMRGINDQTPLELGATA